MVNVKVTYKYSSSGGKPTTTATDSIPAESKSESAVLDALQRRYPTRTIIIISIQ